MKKIFIVVSLIISNLAAASYADKKVTCDVLDHPTFSQTIVYGESEIHFIRKDGADSSLHHDGYNFEESQNTLYAIYHDGDDVLLYLDLNTTLENSEQGLVFIPGHEDEELGDIDGDFHIINNCSITEFSGWN